MAAVVFAVISAMIALVVVAMGASLHFLCDVMQAGRPEVLDGYHQVVYALFRLAIAFVVFSFAMFALPLTMEMLHSLGQFTLRLLGFLVLVVLV